MFNGNSVPLRLDYHRSRVSEWTPADPLLTDWRDRRASSPPHFSRDVSREKSLTARSEKRRLYSQAIKISLFLYSHYANIYRQFVLKKKTKKKKAAKPYKAIRRVHMCAVFKVVKALYLGLRWTPLWLGKWQHKYHVSFLVSPSYHLFLCFVKGHPISARNE